MYFFLSAGIGENLTGIEHAILKRKKIFDACGLAHKILTVNFNPNYASNLALHHIDETSFINLYDDYQKLIFQPFCTNTYEDFLLGLGGHLEGIAHAESGDIRLYQNQIYRFYLHFYPNRQIAYINFFDQNKRKIKRHIYTAQGYLSHIIFLENNQRRLVQYLNAEQKVVIEEYYTEEDQLSLILVHDQQREYAFYEKDQWIQFWIESLVKRYPHSILYSDKNKLYNHILIKIQPKNFKLYSVFHSVHFSNPQQIETGRINSNYVISLSEREHFDGYIASTELQKRDLQARFGSDLNVDVIPPTFSEPILNPRVNHRSTSFKVISVGRYYVEKRLDHIIQAVERLKQKYPDIQLDLYGFGDARDQYKYEKKLRAMVEERQLQETVWFRGYVQDIQQYIENADVSVVTSTIEGFCIGILDSLSVGTPVVAYDIKYGPRDMIEDGKSGFLVAQNQIQELADAIEQVYLHPEMRVSALKSAEKYNLASQKQKWLNHIGALNHD